MDDAFVALIHELCGLPNLVGVVRLLLVVYAQKCAGNLLNSYDLSTFVFLVWTAGESKPLRYKASCVSYEPLGFRRKLAYSLDAYRQLMDERKENIHEPVTYNLRICNVKLSDSSFV